MAELHLDSRGGDSRVPASRYKDGLGPVSRLSFRGGCRQKPVKRRFRHWFWIALLLYFLLLLGIGAFALSSLSRF